MRSSKSSRNGPANPSKRPNSLLDKILADPSVAASIQLGYLDRLRLDIADPDGKPARDAAIKAKVAEMDALLGNGDKDD